MIIKFKNIPLTLSLADILYQLKSKEKAASLSQFIYVNKTLLKDQRIRPNIFIIHHFSVCKNVEANFWFKHRSSYFTIISVVPWKIPYIFFYKGLLLKWNQIFLFKILKHLDAPTLVCFTKIKSQVSRQIHLFLGYLTKVTAFMVTPKLIINALTFCFW